MDALETTFIVLACIAGIIYALTYTDWGKKYILGYTDDEIKELWH